MGFARQRTYTLLIVALDNGEVARVRGGLHDEPADGLLVLTINTTGLDQLGLELVDGSRVVVRTEVDSDGVDHFRKGCRDLLGGRSVARCWSVY